MSIPTPKHAGEYVGKKVIVIQALIQEDIQYLNNIYTILETCYERNAKFIRVEGVDFTFECDNFEFTDEGTLTQYAKRRRTK